MLRRLSYLQLLECTRNCLFVLTKFNKKKYGTKLVEVSPSRNIFKLESLTCSKKEALDSDALHLGS